MITGAAPNHITKGRFCCYLINLIRWKKVAELFGG